MLTHSAVLFLPKFSFGIVQKSRYAVLVTIPPQRPQRPLLLPLLLPRIAVAGMEDRAVVTICGVTKARSTVKVLVPVDGLVIVAIPPQLLPLLLPAIAAAGMEDKAVVTIGGVTKARATAKVLVMVDGLVVALQRIAAAGIKIGDAELTSGVTDPWATAKVAAVESGSNLVVREHVCLALKKYTQNHERTLFVDYPN